MKKYIKWFLLLLVAVLLVGCSEAEQTETAAEPEIAADVDIYYNIDAANYRGHPDRIFPRPVNEEGYYSLQFAGGGEQHRFLATQDVIDSGVDMHELVGLVFDENGIVTDFYPVEDCSGGYFARKYYVEAINGTTAVCNSTPMYDGFTVELELTEDQQVYLADGSSPLTGMPTEVLVDDEITAIMDENGEVFLIYVGHVGEIPDVYFNKTRLYDSANKMTTRERDEMGYFNFEMALNGAPVTVQTKDADVATAMDQIAARNMVLTFDDNGMVDSATEGSIVTGGWFASWCAVTGIEGKNLEFTRVLSGSNQGTVYNGIASKDFVAYDVSGMNEPYGAVTELQLGDTVHCLTNKRGQICIAFVVNRIADSLMYWNVERKYDSKTMDTTRYMWSDGYYHVILAVEGKQTVVRVPTRALVRAMDARADKHFGLKLNGDIVEAVYAPSACTGGTYFASWCDVTEIKDGVVTALRTIESSNQGTYYSCKMAPDCKVYNVTGAADTVGEETTLQIGDRIHGETNMNGELVVIYVVANRTKANTKLYWNVERKYNSTTKLSTRTPDADGWYTFLLACEGKQVTVRTKDQDIVQKMDAKADRYFGLRVNKEGEITLYCSADSVTGGSYFASWCDVTNISGSRVTAQRTIGGSNQGKSYTASMSSTCKVYNVSSNYINFAGEETELRVGDRIQGQKNREGSLVAIFVVERPDLPGTPDHFHCACNGKSVGVGSHSCDDNTGWSAWVNPRRLPTNGNWYLTTDVQLENNVTIPSGSNLKLCLNGHTINGQTTGTGSVFNVNTGLTITDCSATPGEIIGNTDAYGAVMYIYESASPAEVNIFAGTLRCSLESKTRDGGIIYVGNKGVNPAVLNIYGGTIEGANIGSKIGGAIHLIWGTQLNMYGGTITGGKADKGGAIATGEAKVYIYGGTITGNDARLGGGIYIGSKSSLYLDNISITGNTNTPGVGKDVYAVTNTTVTLNGKITLGSMFFNSNVAVPGPDGLDDSSSIAIHKVVTGPFFATDDANDFGCFTSFNKDYKLVYEDGKIATADAVAAHKHCPCNGKAVGKGDHVCTEISYAAWSDPSSLPTSGNYYLTTDVTTSAATTVPTGSKLNLCLCGHTITGPSGGTASVFFVNTGLSIADCSPKDQWGSIVSRNDAYGSVIYVFEHNSAATVDIFAGTLRSANATQTKDGGIIYIGNQGKNLAVVNLYDGKLQGKNIGAGNGGVINIIKKNRFNMYGGTVTGGTAGKGGGIHATNGYISIYGGEITGNTATNGGGIYARDGGKVEFFGGKLTGNTATTDAGNLYATTATVHMYDGAEISGGTAANEGGNVRLASSAFLYMYGGTISGGSANSGGNLMTFTHVYMYGGTIKNGTAKNFGGNICTWSSPIITLDYNSASTSVPTITNGTATTGADVVLRGTAPKLVVNYGKVGFVHGINGSASVGGTAIIQKLHLAGITLTETGLTEGASVKISMAAPGTFLTGCADLTAFITAFDSAYEVVYNGADMVLQKK